MALIEMNHITFKYNDTDVRLALDDISLAIEEQEWVAIIGHNGSGKSTLAKTMNGLIAPTGGTVMIDGIEMSSDTVWEIRQKMGMVFQNPDNQFVGATVEDDVAFGLENAGIDRNEMMTRVDESLEAVGMTAFKTKEPARLSGGQKQRVAIAGVLALSPKIIVLDEATSMLDPKGRLEVIKTIRAIKAEQKLTVISITHDIDEAAHADRIAVIEEGALREFDTPANVFDHGTELLKMGLALPFSERLKLALKQKGFELPDEYSDHERMVKALWTLHSKK